MTAHGGPLQNPAKIAVVTCSTRSPRLNPFITEYTIEVLKAVAPAGINFEIVDLEAQNLPFYNEPGIPARLPKDDPTPHYAHESTRQWSTKIRQFDAFIFVTPQYNWSIPASLKNALDFLYHEWAGKPAMVVSYGGKGGSKAAAHLQQILTSMHMSVTKLAPMFVVSTKTLDYCFTTGNLSDEDKHNWLGAAVDEQLRKSFLAMVDGSDTFSR